jgi:hypothetical protein
MLWQRILIMMCCVAGVASAQDSSTSEVETVVDRSPFISPRASAMAGAYSPFATNLDAAFQNPAGIGGYLEKSPGSFVRQLNFPYAGITVNDSTRALNSDFSSQGGADDAEIGRTIIDAYGGKRQFARASIVPNIVLSRLMLLPILDQQIAAIPQGSGTDEVKMHYRGSYGIGGGFSVSDPRGALTLGVFASSLSVQEVKGTALYSSVINADERNAAIGDITSKFSGKRVNAGLTYKLGKNGVTMFSLVARDLGHSQFNRTSGNGEELKFDEDWSLAFGASPRIGKSMALKYVLQADLISNHDLAIVEKLKTGIEFLYGSDLDRPLVGVRAGYNYSGLSTGFDLNLGMIGLQLASYAEDIGTGNSRVVERRNEISLMIELVE